MRQNSRFDVREVTHTMSHQHGCLKKTLNKDTTNRHANREGGALRSLIKELQAIKNAEGGRDSLPQGRED